MKKTQGYEIDYIENSIIVTKSFLKEAGIIGSTEYTELTQLRKDFPDFTVVQREINRKQNKKAYGKLNYKKMAEFIETQEEENAPAVLAEFEKVQQLSKVHNGPYAFVKTWFLNRYKDVFQQEEEPGLAEA